MSNKMKIISLAVLVLAGVGLVILFNQSTPLPNDTDLAVAEARAYWFSRYNVNALLLMTGMGERLVPAPDDIKALGKRLGFDPNELPANVYQLKSVYASGELYFQEEGNFKDLSTLYWDKSKMDKTLDPAAHSMVIVNVADENLRSDYHETAKDKFIAAIQTKMAVAMTEALETQMKTQDGRYAPRNSDGTLGNVRTEDQFLVLLAYSKLAGFLSESSNFEYAHNPKQAQRTLNLAKEVYDTAPFEKAASAHEMATALEAAIWYNRVSDNPEALTQIEELAARLAALEPTDSVAVAFKVRGLSEVAAYLDDKQLMNAAEETYIQDLDSYWDNDANVFVTNGNAKVQAFTPVDLAAHFGALNSLRNNPQASDGVVKQATKQFIALLKSSVIDSGMQYSHAIPLAVNPRYREQYPEDFFKHPELPLSTEAQGGLGFGGCPMFQSKVQLENGSWSVTEKGQYKTFPALFLAYMIR